MGKKAVFFGGGGVVDDMTMQLNRTERICSPRPRQADLAGLPSPLNNSLLPWFAVCPVALLPGLSESVQSRSAVADAPPSPSPRGLDDESRCLPSSSLVHPPPQSIAPSSHGSRRPHCRCYCYPQVRIRTNPPTPAPFAFSPPPSPACLESVKDPFFPCNCYWLSFSRITV